MAFVLLTGFVILGLMAILVSALATFVFISMLRIFFKILNLGCGFVALIFFIFFALTFSLLELIF